MTITTAAEEYGVRRRKKKNAVAPRYRDGNHYCRSCEKWHPKDVGLRCPDCHARVRTRPYKLCQKESVLVIVTGKEIQRY